MPDTAKNVNLDPAMEGSDDSEDEDYSPETVAKSSKKDTQGDSDEKGGTSGDENLGEYDSGDEKTIGASIPSKKRKRNNQQGEELGTDGGLVKTRSQRAQEGHEVKNATHAPSSTDVDALWAAMNAAPTATTLPKADTEHTPSESKVNNDPEMVQISRTYEFAGEVHTENKTVPKESQEARDYLASLTPEIQTAPIKMYNGKPLRKVLKRKSMLEESAKPKKINTLEKSRMEWSGFVDQEGINDELKRGNKNGYLDKQDFLSKSEHARYDSWKSGQR